MYIYSVISSTDSISPPRLSPPSPSLSHHHHTRLPRATPHPGPGGGAGGLLCVRVPRGRAVLWGGGVEHGPLQPVHLQAGPDPVRERGLPAAALPAANQKPRLLLPALSW